MNEIISYSQGNPGALSFLMDLLLYPKIGMTTEKADIIMKKLKECPTIRGTNLYVLYSDLCNRDVDKVVELCKSCPNNVLEDACSRQDYSGQELVASYLQ